MKGVAVLQNTALARTSRKPHYAAAILLAAARVWIAAHCVVEVHWVLPAGGYLRGIHWRRFSFYLDFYVLILLFFPSFLCIFFSVRTYLSVTRSSFFIIIRCTPDLRLFPAYLLLFHYSITCSPLPVSVLHHFHHIFIPVILHTLFLSLFNSTSFHWLYFSFSFTFALLCLPHFPCSPHPPLRSS